VGGGSIGRAHDNDWVLPDPERYLSAHHARVKFRDGAFHLFDTSTNGVFINERTEALGRRDSYTLRDGDQLRLGDYEIAVSIDSDAAEAPEASAVFPVKPARRPRVSRPRMRGDIGADFSMGDLLRPDPAVSSRNGTLDGFGQSALTEDPGLLAFDRSDRPPASARIHLLRASARR
jgi:type VI secretion system protein